MNMESSDLDDESLEDAGGDGSALGDDDDTDDLDEDEDEE